MNVISNNAVVAVVGLGYVGFPLAIAFSKVRPVIGFDVDKKLIASLKNKINSQSFNDIVVSDDETILDNSNIFIITVQTPVTNEGLPDFTFLQNASKTVGKYIKPGALVIYESTVYPGATREKIIPILERTSGLRLNINLFVGYSPERVNPGDKSKDLSSIKKITSGSNIATATAVSQLYAEIIHAGVVPVSSIEAAEAAKIIENCQREINIAFANELSCMMGALNLDTSEILEAAATKWNFLPVSPGLVGGHCIGVDSTFLLEKAQNMGLSLGLLQAGRLANQKMTEIVATKIIGVMELNNIPLRGSRVGIIGVAYKENVTDLRNSKAFELGRTFQKIGCEVLFIDDLVSPEDVWNVQRRHLQRFLDVSDLDVLILFAPHDVYRSKSLSSFNALFSKNVRGVFVDLKSVFDLEEAREFQFSYIRL